MSSWNNQKIVDNYSDASDNPEKNWYEDEVNVPSILGLLPKGNVRVLDFGCGPGNLTKRLSSDFNVSGADYALNMLEKAQAKSPQLTFFVWDGQSELSGKLFDAIVTKLTLEFIDDLDVVARNFYATLKPDGLVVISVQHPLLAISMHPEWEIPYWNMPKFNVEIGTTGTSVTKIHRNLQQYVEPFMAAGFTLSKIVEPEISPDIASRYNASDLDLKFPKRLNLKFKRD